MMSFHFTFLTLLFFVHTTAANIETPFKDAENAMKYLKNHLTALTQQVMLQQFFVEQRVRSEGQSGLKLVRQRRGGAKNYLTETHTGYAAAAIHDHANNIRTVGMGEFTAVLNGIEFKTRHNDYSLKMPHRTDKTYGATEEVPFPDVPPEVSKKPTIDEQITEMREWFKAWRDQDYSKRDYRKYFKPTLCYLEGSWTTSGQKIEEPFTSDRHFVDAATWMELHEKSRFVSYTGTKSLLENLSFLPTKIIGLMNESVPVFSQWNYRILCHPLKKDVPLRRLRVVDDLSSRMMSGYNIYRHMHSRAARFQLNVKDEKDFYERPVSQRGLLDELMEEIPGKDNYQAELYDEGLDTEVMNDNLTKKDVSRYHRWYRVAGRDAMGTANIHRGYSDDFLFAAMNTQPKVAGVKIRKCKNKWKKDTCYDLEQKWSYAIPLELIYLTPLSKWNPYELKYHGDHRKSRTIAQANGRFGDCKQGANKELNGTTSRLYYVTPNEFYAGGHVGRTGADTSRGLTCVLDQKGVSRQVRASGTHVFLPYITDVGVLRQRYPIFPVHGEGSSVWKELNALRDVVMNDLEHMKWSSSEIEKAKDSNDTELTMGASRSSKTTQHTHIVELTPQEVLQCKGGQDIYKSSSLANNHQHDLRIRWNKTNLQYFYVQCDKKWNCWDGHHKYFTIVELDEDAGV